MNVIAVAEKVKPTELESQQASTTVISLANPNIDQVQTICQELLGRFRENADNICHNTYTSTLAQRERTAHEFAIQQKEVQQVEGELQVLRQALSLMVESTTGVVSDFSTETEQAMVPLVQKGILAAEEAERRIHVAVLELRTRLEEADRDRVTQVEALEEKVANLQALAEKSRAQVTSLDARLADLEQLPAVARHLASLEEQRRRESDRVRATIRFLKTASWREFSRDRKITAKLQHAATVGHHNAAIFEALVERLSLELDRTDSFPPAIAWSVIRVIEQLGLQDMFPDLTEKRSRLALLAQAHKRERPAQTTDRLSGKVVSLASRWGARLAASR